MDQLQVIRQADPLAAKDSGTGMIDIVGPDLIPHDVPFPQAQVRRPGGQAHALAAVPQLAGNLSRPDQVHAQLEGHGEHEHQIDQGDERTRQYPAHHQS